MSLPACRPAADQPFSRQVHQHLPCGSRPTEPSACVALRVRPIVVIDVGRELVLAPMRASRDQNRVPPPVIADDVPPPPSYGDWVLVLGDGCL
jgi:hypothetical protein